MYDYVIVGAGSAGCVLAARLSEDPEVTVCLVEAGPPDTCDNIHVPVAFGKLLRTRYDWDYDTHDEPFCERRRIYLPRGRMLGGSSSMNAMIYIRGNRVDYDGWHQPGWTYDELLPYFKRAEDNERGADAYHGTGGPLTVSDGRSNNPMSAAFVAAALECGFEANHDFNAAGQDGFGLFQVTQRDGMRCSAAVAYLHEAMMRPNLTVLTGFQAFRVLLAGGRATGVAGLHGEEPAEVEAGREVIIAAGAYNSPQLLMLSGIGPAEQLTALGIPVALDQPQVGQNLQDHPHVMLVYTHSQPVSLLAAGEPRYQQQFERERRGPLTSNVGEAGGFVRSGRDLPAPDLQFVAGPMMFADGGLGAPTDHAISYGACVIKPRSRGQLSLASDDPTAKPRIMHNYYADGADLDAAVAGLRIGLEFGRAGALAPYTERLYQPPESESDTDLRAHVRRYTQTMYHPAGTCAMGTVLDSELRVRGIDGLRVADASVMPSVIRGNTNAPVIAIAEKAADLIRGLPLLPVHGTEASVAEAVL